MSRTLTPQSSLENLRREAKRWLSAIRGNDSAARDRLRRVHPGAPADPGLRDVQHALALEHGLSGWTELKNELARQRAGSSAGSPNAALQELLSAADRGDALRAGQLLDDFPEIINQRGTLAGHTGARTALHFGVHHHDVVRLLLERGADPNIRDEGDDAMPLHFAAERGDSRLVMLLIEHGADPVGEGTGHLLNVLGWAVCFDYAYHEEVARYLLAHGARHTIHTAVAMGDVEAIRELAALRPEDLDRQMDRTNRHRRPLHLAVAKKQPESLATLLALGADAEGEDAAGMTPLDQAAVGGEAEMAQLLIDNGARVRLPAAVALDRHDEIARILAESPDCLRPGGRWARLIIRASERAPAPVIESLVQGGASVHVRDDHRTSVDGTHGYTALHAAAFHGNADAARMLLRHGANPMDREDKYWGTPAGWAAYAGHIAVRDLILDAPAIDIFDAILYRSDRIGETLDRDPSALDRAFGEYVTGADMAAKPWLDPAWTPIAFAVANGELDAASILVDRGADLSFKDSTGRSLSEIASANGHADIARMLARHAAEAAPRTHRVAAEGDRVADFLRKACLDWRSSGAERTFLMNDAARMLDAHPEIAHASIFTAVACGAVDVVRRILGERPGAASEIGGPRPWPPLLYLCAARLPSPSAIENAVEIARLLLDHGADPNAFYLGGNADIHYTALTFVLGRGEELASMHPRARELTGLLLESGADPHDNQDLYNVFADNTSRHLLGDDIVWLLELMYEHSIRRGHQADWDDPEWPMFDMRGAPSLGDEERRHAGSRFMLDGAVDRNLLVLAEWLLEHGAGPNTPRGNLWKESKRTLYQEAQIRGFSEMRKLLVRYGATEEPLELAGIDEFIGACLTTDRQRVRSLIERHPEYLRDHRPMFAAVKNDRVDVVEMLLDMGVSPNVEDVWHGRTRTLHVAAGAGAERSVALLIERGADVDFRESNYDGSPLTWASYFQQPAMIELLGRHSRDVWHLTRTGRVDRLREVLGESPELARVSSPGAGTPLFWLPDDSAIAHAVASLFISHGADPAYLNAEGASAADIAARRGMDEVATLLRSAGR